MSLILRAALLCDDVRREDNGKNVLIGVYGGSIICVTYPIVLNLNLFLSARSNGGAFTAELRTRGGGMLSHRTLSVEENVPDVVFICPMSIGLLEPRDLVVDLRVDGGVWNEVGSWTFGFVEEPTMQNPDVARDMEEWINKSKLSSIGMLKYFEDVDDERIREVKERGGG